MSDETVFASDAVPIDILTVLRNIRRPESPQDIARLLDELCACAQPLTLAFVNAHAVNLAQSNPTFLNDLAQADIVLRDGKGMEILYRLAGMSAGANMNGTDLIPRLLDTLKGRRMVILGTRSPWVEGAVSHLRDKGHHIADSRDGFQDVAVYRDIVARHRPDVVLLGMGMPVQERVARVLCTDAEYGTLVICGGAILDFMAGRVPRAPRWMRHAGLEWLYRLSREPRRLAGRYVVGNITFLYRAWRLSRLLRQSSQNGDTAR